MSGVVVSGIFGELCSKDIRFLEEASRYGAVHVVLWSDRAACALRGKEPKFPEQERVYFLEALRFVEGVTLWDRDVCEGGLPELEQTPARWVMEESAVTEERRNWCRRLGVECLAVADKALERFPDLQADEPIRPASGRKVIVTGCYDWFHSGHVRFFEEVSAHGSLYVVVGSDANLRLLKGEGHPMFPARERRYVVGAVRHVHQALVSTGSGWMDAEPEIERIRPDIYAVNEDGDKPEKREYCRKHGLQYLVLKRTPKEGLPRRQSTDLRGF